MTNRFLFFILVVLFFYFNLYKINLHLCVFISIELLELHEDDIKKRFEHNGLRFCIFMRGGGEFVQTSSPNLKDNSH